MSRCSWAKAKWTVRDALRSKSCHGCGVGKEDGKSFPSQTSYGSRTFTCSYLQFKTVTLSSHVNGGITCNFSHLILLLGAARKCFIWWEMQGSGKQWGVGLETRPLDICSSMEMLMAPRPGDVARWQLVTDSVLLSIFVTMSESFMIIIILTRIFFRNCSFSCGKS